jgi:hypothetical protein
MTLVVDRLQDDGTGNSDAVQDLIDGRAKACGSVDQTSTGHPLLGFSLNVSSTTDVSGGLTDIEFTNAFTEQFDYSPVGTGGLLEGGVDNRSSSQVRVVSRDSSGVNTDADQCGFASHGTLA